LAAGAQLLPMFSDAELEDAATRAEAIYTGAAIDIALMGMGGDGHTASWFPHSPDLDLALNSRRTVVAVHAQGAAGSPARLTLTRAALANAKAIVLLITGADKRVLLEDQARQRLPVDRLFAPPLNAQTFWAP
jgi:6-phosphogluconolactonase